MSLRDRLRETAQQAQEGLAKGQAKLEQFQNRQSANEQLQALGQAYWVQQSGRATVEQLQIVFEAVAPTIAAAEGRLGLLPWPPVPVPADPDPASPAAAGAPMPTTPYPGQPVADAPVVGADAPSPAPSSIPAAIHHDPPPETD